MPKLNSDFEDKYVLCLYEGNSEIAIMNMLIDQNKLLFERDSLVQKKVHKRVAAKIVQDQFLNLDYDKGVIILRIIDSRSEKFNLGKLYKDKFQVLSINTTPEIEILVIITEEDIDEFNKVKSTEKPSEFCKRKYRYKDIKTGEFVNRYYSDLSKLLDAIQKHKSSYGKECLTISDLLK